MLNNLIEFRIKMQQIQETVFENVSEKMLPSILSRPPCFKSIPLPGTGVKTANKPTTH